MTTAAPTRLDVLIEARAIAQRLGAVRDGRRYFEDAEGGRINPFDVVHGVVAPEAVCRVCIVGAYQLAEILLGINAQGTFTDSAYRTARAVLGDEAARFDDALLTDAITEKGTPYMLAVLDRMIADERERHA